METSWPQRKDPGDEGVGFELMSFAVGQADAHDLFSEIQVPGLVRRDPSKQFGNCLGMPWQQ